MTMTFTRPESSSFRKNEAVFYSYIYVISTYSTVLSVLMRATTRPKRRLKREDWVAASLEVLLLEGVGAVTIDRLAEELHVTRGSFYHHFSDRAELHDALLAHWAEERTHRVREEVASLKLDPATALLVLLRTLRRRRTAGYDAAFRAWALHDERARALLQQVDGARFEFVRGQFEQLGFRGIDLENRARLFMYYEIASPAMFLENADEQADALLVERHRFLTQR